jgi:hypothetical protein
VHRASLLLFCGLALAAVFAGCASTAYQAKLAAPDKPHEIDVEAPFLKCHMKDGSLYVLERWSVDVPTATVTGEGLLYDAARNRQPGAAHWSVPARDVALFETNRPESIFHYELTGLVAVTIGSAVVTAVCLANPKACFGSCPTFYATDGEHDVLMAEGFSSSIARVFEATDVDSLWAARPSGRGFDVRMTNEALETHMVDRVRLLAAPRPSDGRVLRAGETYYAAKRLLPPETCTSPLGSCLSAVTAVDDKEYLSPASEQDLAERETVSLTFPRGHGRVGLVIGARNSLLNTFIFYQGLAFMGSHAGEWFARLDAQAPGSEGQASSFSAFGAQLGSIDVSVDKGGEWHKAGSFSEVGPIAHEVQLVVLPAELPDGEVHVRLDLVRGNWKIDMVALAELGEPVVPTALDPVRVTKDGAPAPDALAKLLSPGAHLVTYPGDAYTLHFVMPESIDPSRVELFLESRGYYYEWMRRQWLEEENALEVARILLDPGGAMKRLAPKYKRIEGQMEDIFWQSRFGARP